jgi:hypothetical protein
MTENGTWTEEYILASDVWCVEKSITPLTDEEQRDKWELGRRGPQGPWQARRDSLERPADPRPHRRAGPCPGGAGEG